MATVVPNYYCHKCEAHIGHVTNLRCPRCRDSFIEEIPSQNSSSHSRSGQSHNRSRIHLYGSTPFGSTTIVIGGDPSSSTQNYPTNNADIGTFFQAILSQLHGGQQIPFGVPNNEGVSFFDGASLDAFLTQVLNQLGENGGPAPAPESRINSLPAVKITAAQANDSLQCTICMDDFKENDEAKRLPCSHHFHEECISRWLRLHGTCPTCRVTLEGDNTSSHEYHNIFSNLNQSSSRNNNRRNDRGNNGSRTAGSTLFDFD